MRKHFRIKRIAVIAASLLLAVVLAFSAVGCRTQVEVGPKGDNGVPGQDGKTPFIGKNGNWWVGDVDTGVYAGTTPDPLKALNETTAPISKNVSGYVFNNGKFYPDYSSMNEALAASRELNMQIGAEGIVLMKNADNVLPLKKGSNVTMFGHRSYNPMTGGGGSGAGKVGVYGVPFTDLVAGVENSSLSVNKGVENVYRKAIKEAGNTTQEGFTLSTANERPVSILKDIEYSYGRYADAAIITLGRSGSEGSDIKMKNCDGHSNKEDHFLQLEDNEIALIKYVKKHFDKVIVLVNSANTLELGELNAEKTEDNLGVDAILHIGHLGNDGAAHLGDILDGTISPSGRTVDTWINDLTTSPSYANFSSLTQNGGADNTAGWNNNLYNPDGTVNASYHYAEYSDSIYVGYKYYETAYDDIKSGNYANITDADKWYNDQVTYPFGYGLSYTSFKWQLVGAGQGEIKSANETVTLKVKVTNTGKVAGKDVVQMYVNPPYTLGGIEKSSANLVAFAKTDTLKPGESQTVTLQCVAQDFASFDWNDANGNGYTGYELEAGDYVISVNNNAHEEAFSVTRTVKEDIECKTDYTTGETIKAVFSQNEGVWAEYNSVIMSLKDNLMSRVDITSVPVAATIANRTMSQGFVDAVKSLDMHGSYKDEATDPWYVSEKPANWVQENDPDNNRAGGMVDTLLRDMAGINYQEYKVVDGKVVIGTDADSQKWEEFLNKLTWDEMLRLVQYGWYGRQSLDSIGMVFQADTDGPQHLGSSTEWISNRAPGVLYPGTCWVAGVIQASTYNSELMEAVGESIGSEGLFQNVQGWYGPGMNTHRSPFGGRNFEYFSEDGYLAGKIASSIVRGVSSKGIVTYIKHFALNEQEADRDTLFTSATEQSIREIYLKPFEMCIKEGHSMGIMTSKNRIGKVGAEANAALNNEIVRGEWGFKGTIITDAYTGQDCKTVDLMLRAGTDAPLGGIGRRRATGSHYVEKNRWDAATNMVYVSPANEHVIYNSETVTDDQLTVASPTLYYAVRRAALHLLFTAANSSGNYNGLVNGQNEITLNWTTKTSFVYHTYLTKDWTLSNVKIIEGSLPKGVTLDSAGVFKGDCSEAEAGTYTIKIQCVADGWIGLESYINQHPSSQHNDMNNTKLPEDSRIDAIRKPVEITVTIVVG